MAGITASEASILMLYYGLVLLLPGLAVTTRVRVTFTFNGKVQHLIEGDYDPTYAFDVTDPSRAFAITGMPWATSYDILVELVYNGGRVVVEHHREQLSLLAWRPSGPVTENSDGVKRIRADFQAARTASSRCREGRYTFLLPPFPIYAKQTAPDKESLEWHLSNAGGFYYVPRLASLGDCAISVVLVAQKLLGLDLFHNYLEVRVAIIYISGYHSMASVMRKELVEQLNAAMRIFRRFNNRQLHDELHNLAPSTLRLIDYSVNGKREQGEWLDSLHLEVLLRLLFITAGVTDEARISALFTVSTNPDADLGLFHKYLGVEYRGQLLVFNNTRHYVLAVQANTALGRGLRSIVEENSGFRLTKEELNDPCWPQPQSLFEREPIHPTFQDLPASLYRAAKPGDFVASKDVKAALDGIKHGDFTEVGKGGKGKKGGNNKPSVPPPAPTNTGKVFSKGLPSADQQQPPPSSNQVAKATLPPPSSSSPRRDASPAKKGLEATNKPPQSTSNANGGPRAWAHLVGGTTSPSKVATADGPVKEPTPTAALSSSPAMAAPFSSAATAKSSSSPATVENNGPVKPTPTAAPSSTPGMAAPSAAAATAKTSSSPASVGSNHPKKEGVAGVIKASPNNNNLGGKASWAAVAGASTSKPQVVDREVKAAAPTAAGAKAITDSGKQVVAPQPSPTSATAGGVKAVDYAAALRSGTTSQVSRQAPPSAMSAATRPPATLTNNKDGARATTTTTTTGSGNSKQRQPNTTDGRCTQQQAVLANNRPGTTAATPSSASSTTGHREGKRRMTPREREVLNREREARRHQQQQRGEQDAVKAASTASAPGSTARTTSGIATKAVGAGSSTAAKSTSPVVAGTAGVTSGSTSASSSGRPSAALGRRTKSVKAADKSSTAPNPSNIHTEDAKPAIPKAPEPVTATTGNATAIHVAADKADDLPFLTSTQQPGQQLQQPAPVVEGEAKKTATALLQASAADTEMAANDVDSTTAAIKSSGAGTEGGHQGLMPEPTSAATASASAINIITTAGDVPSVPATEQPGQQLQQPVRVVEDEGKKTAPAVLAASAALTETAASTPANTITTNVSADSPIVVTPLSMAGCHAKTATADLAVITTTHPAKPTTNNNTPRCHVKADSTAVGEDDETGTGGAGGMNEIEEAQGGASTSTAADGEDVVEGSAQQQEPAVVVDDEATGPSGDGVEQQRSPLVAEEEGVAETPVLEQQQEQEEGTVVVVVVVVDEKAGTSGVGVEQPASPLVAEEEEGRDAPTDAYMEQPLPILAMVEGAAEAPEAVPVVMLQPAGQDGNEAGDGAGAGVAGIEAVTGWLAMQFQLLVKGFEAWAWAADTTTTTSSSSSNNSLAATAVGDNEVSTTVAVPATRVVASMAEGGLDGATGRVLVGAATVAEETAAIEANQLVIAFTGYYFNERGLCANDDEGRQQRQVAVASGGGCCGCWYRLASCVDATWQWWAGRLNKGVAVALRLLGCRAWPQW